MAARLAAAAATLSSRSRSARTPWLGLCSANSLLHPFTPFRRFDSPPHSVTPAAPPAKDTSPATPVSPPSLDWSPERLQQQQQSLNAAQVAQAVGGVGAAPVGGRGEVAGGNAVAAERGASRQRSHGVHVFQCTDRLGIVARISECVASRHANLLNVDLHIDFEAPTPVFYSRSEFSFDPARWPRQQMEADFASLAADLGAQKSLVRVAAMDKKLRMAVLASQQDHCLVDLLYRWQEGVLPVDIHCVISNHPRGENTHVRRFLERHGIPFHHLPVDASTGDKREGDILELVKGSNTDFLVLARYMQVLSPAFLSAYGRDIINIHHGLLPSFKGANPYLQAFKAGVKLIGATSHFVTDELDCGPIIEQLVDRVSHREGLASFAAKSKILEKQCLAAAVKYYAEHRILRYSHNKTIVFV
ncbi:hypothetical protein CLOM_g16722 [Closterium sp. NIES-68]|nr:hypothetical protein CLOM_g16722 [Closterium sp. NIES-68]GJP66608.1 hypothetical protein CLOP_g23523 [Closterium sp. NIES-67]